MTISAPTLMFMIPLSAPSRHSSSLLWAIKYCLQVQSISGGWALPLSRHHCRRPCCFSCTSLGSEISCYFFSPSFSLLCGRLRGPRVHSSRVLCRIPAVCCSLMVLRPTGQFLLPAVFRTRKGLNWRWTGPLNFCPIHKVMSPFPPN